MALFKKKNKIEEIPDDVKGFEIRTESSICTGETVIGFYDPKKGRLVHEEFVADEKDIRKFCSRYGIDADKIKRG